MYNKDVCCYYIREYIITTNIFIVHEKCISHYKRQRMMTIFIFPY